MKRPNVIVEPYLQKVYCFCCFHEWSGCFLNGLDAQKIECPKCHEAQGYLIEHEYLTLDLFFYDTADIENALFFAIADMGLECNGTRLLKDCFSLQFIPAAKMLRIGRIE